MLTEILTSKDFRSEQVALTIADTHLTWGELRDSVASLTKSHQRLARRRVGLRFSASPLSYALLFALEALEADSILLNGSLSDDESVQLARELRLGALLSTSGNVASSVPIQEFPDEAAGSAKASVTLLTSGTTGKPKAARHTWQSLGRPVRRNEKATSQRWLQTYRPNLYAGLQVFLQCFLNQGTLYVPAEGWGPSEISRFAAANRVEYISATPSYWRWFLLFSDPAVLKALNPAQVTLGGEVVDQSILDSLRERFPGARIVHVFATTELGRCFSVTDGLQGFPRKFLDGPSADGVEMRIGDGELLVRSANAMSGYDPFSHETSFEQDWIATGDLVTVKDDRVTFTGRRTDMINVGGNKVHPIEVERVIRSVPGVWDVRVFAKRSSVSGQLVACEIVSDRTRSDAQLQEAVQRTCHANLSAHQRPRLIRIVERIELSTAQKTVRNNGH